jgi:hypothetical protein
MKVDRSAVYGVSDEVVAREIAGEIIIVPLGRGIADLEDELFTLNEMGRVIWQKLHGRRSLNEVIEDLKGEWQGDDGEIEADVLGFIAELTRRRILVVVEPA